jgi:hypothetical protein
MYLEPCVELRYLRSMRRSGLDAGLPAGTEAEAFESGHGGETMEKEPYVTPEITTEEVTPGALADGCGCG